jgi:hypothetical protein
MLLTLFWLLTLLALVLTLAYRRTTLRAATVALGLWLVAWQRPTTGSGLPMQEQNPCIASALWRHRPRCFPQAPP